VFGEESTCGMVAITLLSIQQKDVDFIFRGNCLQIKKIGMLAKNLKR